MTDWRTLRATLKELSDWDAFWEANGKAAVDLAQRIVGEIGECPVGCAPIVLAALDTVREAMEAGKDDATRRMDNGVAQHIQQYLHATTLRVIKAEEDD